MAIRATINLTKVNASVTSEVLQAGVHYTLNNATDIWVDPDSNNRFVNDVYTLSDVQFTLLEKNFTETVTLPDVAGLHPSLPKTDSVGILDNFARVVAYNRAFNDVFTLDDASLIDKEYYGNKGNVAFMLDVIGLSPEKIIADSVTVGDVLYIAMLFGREFTDTATIDDELGIVANKHISEALIFNDSSNAEVNKILTESVSITDLFNFTQNKGVSEAVSLGEHIANVTSKPIDGDLFTISDAYGLQLQKTLSDSFALDDAALVDKNYFGNKGNIVGLTDLVAISHVESRVLSYKTLNRLTLN